MGEAQAAVRGRSTTPWPLRGDSTAAAPATLTEKRAMEKEKAIKTKGLIQIGILTLIP